MILLPATRADSAAIEHWLALCVGVSGRHFVARSHAADDDTCLSSFGAESL